MIHHKLGKIALSFIFVALIAFVGSSVLKANASAASEKICTDGVLLVGTTGDYYPMSYLDAETGEYRGFEIDLARELADSLGVTVQFVKTTWPTLMEDLEKGLFDCAISGISITDARKERANMSKGYLNNGKTILCRAADADFFRSLDDINSEDITVMVNPGGTNQKFADEMLDRCKIVVHDVNYEIPELILKGTADIMITETVEAGYYIAEKEGLAAPLIDAPFTDTQIGILIPKERKDLLEAVNAFLLEEQITGKLAEIARNNHIFDGCLCEVK